MKSALFFFIGVILTLLVMFIVPWSHNDSKSTDQRDTVLFRDTIFKEKLVASRVGDFGLERVTLPLYYNRENESSGDSTVNCTESDSVTVLIPIKQYTFNSEDYKAVISGFRVSLDTLMIFPQNKTINIKERPPDKHWAIGPSLGLMYDGRRFSLSGGITITYIFYSF